MGGDVTLGSLKRLTTVMAGQDIDSVDINGGAIDGAVIGAASAVAGTFTTLTATSLIEGTEAGTTATNLSNSGLTTFGSESTAATTYTLDAPVAGVIKRLLCDSGSTLAKTVYTGSSLVSIGSTTATDTVTRMAFDLYDEAVVLEGLSTVKWGILVNTGSVALSS